MRPEIMVPLVGTLEELRRTREVIDRVAQEVFKETKTKVSYLVGTMIEVPARGTDRRADRAVRRLLLVRHQRPDPDDVRCLA